MKIKIYKLKKEKVDSLKEWFGKLVGELHQEARDSLKEENCVFESARIFYINDEPYLLGIMIAEEGKELVRGSDSPINVEHRKIMKEAILEEVSTEELYTILSLK